MVLVRQVGLVVVLGLCGCPTDPIDLGGAGSSADTGEYGESTGADLLEPHDLPTNGNCSPDAHDPNDTRADASEIAENGELEARLCAGTDEADWYSITLTEPSYVGVEVVFEQDGQDVALELSEHDTTTLIDRAEGGADIQAIHALLEPGTYDILVERKLGDPSYTLRRYALSTANPPSVGGATRVFCPRFDLDGQYTDRSTSADMREDFGLDDSPDRWRPEGMLVRVTDLSSNARSGWQPLDEQGCTAPVAVAEDETEFVLEYVLWSHFVRPQQPDTFVILYDCEDMQPCELPARAAEFDTAPGMAVKEAHGIATALPGDEFREELMIYWAAAFAESRLSMGVDAHIYARVLGSADLGGGQYVACPNEYCPNGTSCEWRKSPGFKHCRPKTRANTSVGGHPTLDIASDNVNGSKFSGAPEQRFTIVHEFGHVQTIWLPGADGLPFASNYHWCSAGELGGSNHTPDSTEWQSAAMIEGFADFYATAVFNQLGLGAWKALEDIENDTQRYAANCQASLDGLIMDGKCTMPGDVTSCSDAGGSNEIDWAGTLWDFSKAVGAARLPDVLRLLSDAFSLNWDTGSTTTHAYDNMRSAASQRFPAHEDDFDDAAQLNGTNR